MTETFEAPVNGAVEALLKDFSEPVHCTLAVFGQVLGSGQARQIELRAYTNGDLVIMKESKLSREYEFLAETLLYTREQNMIQVSGDSPTGRSGPLLIIKV